MNKTINYVKPVKNIKENLTRLMLKNNFIGIVLTEGKCLSKTENTVTVKGIDSDQQPFPKPCFNTLENCGILTQLDVEICEQDIEDVVKNFLNSIEEVLFVKFDNQWILCYLKEERFGLVSFLSSEIASNIISIADSLISLDKAEREEYENAEEFYGLLENGFNHMLKTVGTALCEDMDFYEQTEFMPVPFKDYKSFELA